MPGAVPSISKVRLPATGLAVVVRISVSPVAKVGAAPFTPTMSAMSAPVFTAKAVVLPVMALLRKVRSLPVPRMLAALTSVMR